MRRTPRSLLHWPLRTIVLLACLLAERPAGAQDIAAAEALFDKGVADMKAGRHETGCKAIAESQRLDPRPGTLFTLATCEAAWGRIATAVSRYGDYLAVYARLPDDKKAAQLERFKVATETRAKLLPEVPRLTLSLPAGAPPGTVVKRNGEVVAEAALGVPLPVDPGDHTLSTKAPGGPVRERRLTIGKGQTMQVTLEVSAGEREPLSPVPSPLQPAPLATSAVPEPADKPPSGRRIAAYVVGGAGLLGLAAGAVMGGLAVERKGVMDRHCGAGIGQRDGTACDPTGLDASSAAKTAATASTIALAAGGALAGVGLVLFLTEPKIPPSGTRAPAMARESPRVAAGVLSVGPAGAVLGAQGSW